jgi:hypothetical protein
VLGNPQSVHVEGLGMNNCDTSGFDACIVVAYELPLLNLNKTGLDAGIVTGTNGRVYVGCEDVWWGLDIECEYDATGLQFTVGAQHLTADDTLVDEIGPDTFCPVAPTLDGLLDTTTNRYILA